MIDWYPSIKEYYDNGWQSAEEIKIYVVAGWITPEQYKEITGIEYKA